MGKLQPPYRAFADEMPCRPRESKSERTPQDPIEFLPRRATARTRTAVLMTGVFRVFKRAGDSLNGRDGLFRIATVHHFSGEAAFVEGDDFRETRIQLPGIRRSIGDAVLHVIFKQHRLERA